MTRKRPQLAKLARPRLHHAVARESLFARLDGLRADRSAVCIVGPPGAGKTTLAASWLDARSNKGIWYQVDSGDADLATFFHYLGEAAASFATRGQGPLPSLTPEYLEDIDGFSRRFFRALFARLPGDATVVLDNYQEVEAGSYFHRLVAEAVAEVPAGQFLAIVSRRDPPECYARLVANERVAFIDWSQLRLSLDEARAIVAQRALLDDAALRRLHERSGGWAAGLTLLLEEREPGDAPLDETSRVFDYFAGQILRRASPVTQRFLIETSMLPSVTVSLARALTSNEAAADILEDLYRRHLFVHRRPGPEPVYVYHALFREFLKGEALRVLSPAAITRLSMGTGRLVERAGLHEDAFELFASARDWSSCVRLVLDNARRLMALGRWQTLGDWLKTIPRDAFEQEPRLEYWLGMAMTPTSHSRARAQLETAFDRLRAKGDIPGQALAAAAIIDTIYFEWSAFHGFHRWIEALVRIVDAVDLDLVEDELRVRSSLLIATLFVAPGHPLLAKCIARVEEILAEPLDGNTKLRAASHLLAYCGTACDFQRARRIESAIAPVLGDPVVTPFNGMWWNLRVGQCHLFQGRYDVAVRYLEDAARVVRSEGFSGTGSAALLVDSFRMLVAGAKGQVAAATAIAAGMESIADPNRPTDMFMLHQTRLRLAALHRDVPRMQRSAPALVEAATSTGMTNIEVLALLDASTVMAVLGGGRTLDDCLTRVRRLVNGTCLAHYEIGAALIEAYATLRSGDMEGGHTQLRKALEDARRTDYIYANPLRTSFVLPELLADALAADIERDYITDVIRRYQVAPANDVDERWPWRLRIRTLGRFEIHRDNVPIEFTGKSPRRVLMLLKAIIALGVTAVPVRDLIDALWPDGEGDTGYDNFTVTIGRLRRLLGSQEAVLLTGEKVSIDPTLCWIDTVALDRMLDGDTNATDVPNILAVYRGRFLNDEPDAPWVLRPRLRWQHRFLRYLDRVGSEFEATGEWSLAAECYDRGLEVDDLAEGFYQGLMRCHLAMGRSAEGLAVFRRLRRTLSVVLGVGPSAISRGLAKQLGERAPPP